MSTFYPHRSLAPTLIQVSKIWNHLWDILIWTQAFSGIKILVLQLHFLGEPLKPLRVSLLGERLPSPTEMKRLCEITPDSSGWACGIGIAKIFSAVIFRVPKLQSLNLPIMDFLYWKLWYTVVLSTDQDVCFWKKPGMVPFGQGNVWKRSREEIMRKRTTAHFVRFGIQLAMLAITTPQLVRMANSTKICSCKLAR